MLARLSSRNCATRCPVNVVGLATVSSTVSLPQTLGKSVSF